VCRNVDKKEYNKYIPGDHPFEKHCDKCDVIYIPHVGKHICEKMKEGEVLIKEGTPSFMESNQV
jgi:hypothetical protein